MADSSCWPTTRVTLLNRLGDAQDDIAWRQFVDLYLPLIYRYSKARGLQDADAQNVAQEVLSQVHHSVRTFRYDPLRGRFRNWLRLITTQRIGRLLSKEHGAVRAAGDGAMLDLCEAVPAEQDAVWLELLAAQIYCCARETARAEFDAETWQVFEQVWEQGHSPQDVAARLQRPPGWVYQAKFRVLARVKKLVTTLAEDVSILHRVT